MREMKSKPALLKIFSCQLLLLSFFATIPFTGMTQPGVGSVFPEWSEGYLDIHNINTGKGESSFFIFPDGTTMLVDAGATQRPTRVTDQKPDNSRAPGEWIARYIEFMTKPLPAKRIDYVLITHFHSDHMGDIPTDAKTSKKGDWKLAGITEVAEYIPFEKLIDRGWPDYNYPVPQKEEYVQNYIRFTSSIAEKDKTVMEQFKVGENKQITLVNHPEKYPGFEIRNLAANGYVWTGVGNHTKNHFLSMESLDPSQYPSENKLSCAFRLSYGKFDYFNGGDITTDIKTPGSWQDIETAVGTVSGTVDICVANHHACCQTAMGMSFLQAVRPRVFIIQSWAPSHPDPTIIARMMSTDTYPGPRDVFSTNLMEEAKIAIGASFNEMKSTQGHIVIRVDPDGSSYMIYILDDSEENFKITAIHGPYLSNE